MKQQNQTFEISTPQSGDDLTVVVKIKVCPTERQIQQRTRELHLARGGKGHPLLDWLQADRELTAMLNGLPENKPAVRDIVHGFKPGL